MGRGAAAKYGLTSGSSARSWLGYLQIVKLDAIPLRSQCDHAASVGRIFDRGDRMAYDYSPG
jgi:hypothetical protein